MIQKSLLTNIEDIFNNACDESLNQNYGKILPCSLDHLFINSLFNSEKIVNIICHNSLKKYALRYKRQNKLLY